MKTKKINYQEIEKKKLSVGMLSAYTVCYRNVFGGSPWNEWLQCGFCKKRFGKEESFLRKFQAENQCPNCFRGSLKNYWEPEIVKEDLMVILSREGSVYFAMSKEKEVVGFTSGYQMTFDSLRKRLAIDFLADLSCEEVMYHAEYGVLPEYRRMGIAQGLYDRQSRIVLQDTPQHHVARTSENSPLFVWFTQKLGYKVVAKYNDAQKRVILHKFF